MDEQELLSFSRRMRRDILDMGYRAGSEGAHLGGCLSLVEILSVLYSKVLRFDPQQLDWPLRDRVVLSKAHASIALYAAMHIAGLLTDEEIRQPLYGKDTFLYKHSKRSLAHGIEMSGGSLGQGLPFAVGIAYALRMKGNYTSRVFAIVGDGECDEGSIWESAAFAGHHQLTNLTVIIDKNGMQLDGATKDIINMENMAQRWQAFGFETMTVDGHDYRQLLAVFELCPSKPLAIVANTVKGNGVSFAQMNPVWHAGCLTDELYQKALEEMGE